MYDKTANLTVDVDGDSVNDSDPGYGQLLREIDFEGRVTQYLYDNSASGRGRLVARRYFESTSAFNGGAGTPQRVISYRYDAFGRQVEVSDNAFIDATTQDTIPTTYDYDADGRLVMIDSPQGRLHKLAARTRENWKSPKIFAFFRAWEGFGAMAVRAPDTWRAPPRVGIEEPAAGGDVPPVSRCISRRGQCWPAGMRASHGAGPMLLSARGDVGADVDRQVQVFTA